MATGAFEKDSIGWRFQQLLQRGGEWWELQLQKWFKDIPNPNVIWVIVIFVMFILLVFLLIWLGWRLWQWLDPYIQRIGTQISQSIENKAQTEISVAGWLKRSAQFQQRGNYSQACRCLYLAMLQRLHDSGLILHQDSRTDGEYLYLIQQLPQPDPYETLLITHQQLCFADRSASLSLLEECQQAYQQIDLTTLNG